MATHGKHISFLADASQGTVRVTTERVPWSGKPERHTITITRRELERALTDAKIIVPWKAE